jgi:hypothetical protein
MNYLKRGGLMKNKIKVVIILILFLLCASGSGAEDKFGVKVYAGAKLDKDTSTWISESFSSEAFCYRTSDSVEKVVEFYKKEPGMNFVGSTKEGGMFKKDKIDITIQSPWQDMKTGQLMKDTFISIVRQSEGSQTYDESGEEK